MSNFIWNDGYSVHVLEIDTQHKKLFAMVDSLDQAMREGRGKDRLETILKDLLAYTRTHFGREEQLMESHGYPDLEAHQEIHRKMTGKVEQIIKEYQSGNTRIVIDVSNFLQDWLTKHILGTDMKYTPYVNGKG